MASIDAILSRHAKTLKPGETLTLTLVKGPTSQSVDPLLARAAAAKDARASGAFAGGHAAVAEPLTFPRVAKFVETVEKPDFAGTFRGGRFYEENVPEVKDESDDDEDGAEGSDPKKKKRRWRKNEPPKQHWVLQEKAEFIERMNAKRRRRAGAGAADPKAAAAAGDSAGGGGTSNGGSQQVTSSRYEGVPEYNPSSYVLLSVESDNSSTKGKAAAASDAGGGRGTVRPPERLTVVPVHGFHNFSQPARFATLSMHEAERAIADQRNHMTRYMMHGRKGDAAAAAAGASVGPPVKGGMAKARLLGKLVSKAKEAAADGDADDDDVMGDLAFRERKGGSAKARKELLTSLGDGGVTVDDDGVLGGANDAVFGGARRFGRLAVPTKKAAADDEGEEDGGGGRKKGGGDGAGGSDEKRSGAGNDGLAMEEDFYQRDVGAEYEEMDYDANEQFDDDDVDVGGEGEEVDAGSGFAADVEDEVEDDDDEYDEEGLAGAMGGGGAAGLATSAGLKALMAKARGEADGTAPTDVDAQGKKTTAYGRDEPGAAAASDQSEDEKAAAGEAGGLAQVIAGAEKAKAEAEKAKAGKGKERPEAGAKEGVELDENGQRVISLTAVRKEIWLHHGAITMKRLMKIFNIKKKAGPERTNKFREVVRELCTMKQDKVEGNMLVLKQHYSNMS